MTKLDYVLQIVDWEYRYLDDFCHGGEWVLDRVGFYMTSLDVRGVKRRWEDVFWSVI